MRKLIVLLSKRAPFMLEAKRIAKLLSISDERTLNDYLGYLETLRLISLLSNNGSLNSRLSKPQKIYLDNPTSACAMSYNTMLNHHTDKGNLGGTFFHTSLKPKHELNSSLQGDFIADDTFFFEVGGKGKNFQ